MLIPLAAATAAKCGAKAAALATLLHADLPVPPGVVIPFDNSSPPRGRRVVDSGANPRDFRTQFHDSANGVRANPHDSTNSRPAVGLGGEGAGGAGLSGEGGDGEILRWLVEVGDVPVAVRSSASDEDSALGSAAGQYDSFLGVQGIDAVLDAVRACRESLWSARATSYRGDVPAPRMAVIIQRHVDADVSGVMFTADHGPTLIESSWGLGPTVVEGRVTPDRYEVDGTVTRTIADKPTALHRAGARLETRAVPEPQRRAPTLTDTTAIHLATLGHQAATVFGSPQDIEWAIADNTIWLLQSRPITAEPPASTPVTHAASSPVTHPPSLTGIPGSHGIATGPARIVRGPADFPQVRPGDILVCPHTDPAWTPLLSIAAGIITESGGLLSHAAIVAREQGIPAVLAVPQATTRIQAGTPVTINGSTGAVQTLAGARGGS